VLRLSTCLAAALLAVVPAVSADPLPASAPRVVDYTIDVQLDPVKKTLDGRQRLTWTNPSTDHVGDLWFHLYLNAFRNNRSTFFKESGGQLRGDRMEKDGWGWTDVTSMRLADGTDLLKAATFERPDDGNVEDFTVMRVPLPTPVAPGGSVTLDITWKAKLPKVFARTGYSRDYYLVGQWYPKIAVYEPAGRRGRAAGGWNCHQFHANSEFYADFGRFTVTFTVPANFVVGATGRRTAATPGPNGTRRYTYEQADVHDFAWTADPRFVEYVERFSAREDVSQAEYTATADLLGRTLEEVRLSDVEIHLLLQPGREPQAQRYIAAAKAGIKYFGLWYGRYPYKTLTVVDPALDAGGSGGMEYPTFITGGTSAIFNWWPLDEVRALEQVTVHEFGHQFWYGLVASNEFEEAWLDEGVNSYSTGRVMDTAYGADVSVARLPFLKIGEEDLIRAQNTPLRIFDRVRANAWSYSPGAYSFYSYTKPELLLRTLEGYLGRTTMARVMRTYHERWRFRHPSSDDFYAVANEVSGRDLAWYFKAVVEGSGVIDYEVVSATSEREVQPQGRLAGKAGAWTLVEADDKNADKAPWRTRVVVRRLGTVAFPTVVQLTWEDGSTERVPWDGSQTWTRIDRLGPKKLRSAVIDPENRITLEVNRTNNGKRLEPDTRLAASWTSRWIFWLQNVLAGGGL
jgi:hypothetical protein